MTTRATPADQRASASARERTPPPTCTGTSTAVAMRPMTSRFTGSPVRAASRSTTWIHGAPSASPLLGLADRVVAEVGGPVVVPLLETHAAPTEQVDGGVEVHVTRARKLARSCWPARPDFSGWNCMAQTLPCSTPATTGPP